MNERVERARLLVTRWAHEPADMENVKTVVGATTVIVWELTEILAAFAAGEVARALDEAADASEKKWTTAGLIVGEWLRERAAATREGR